MMNFRGGFDPRNILDRNGNDTRLGNLHVADDWRSTREFNENRLTGQPLRPRQPDPLPDDEMHRGGHGGGNGGGGGNGMMSPFFPGQQGMLARQMNYGFGGGVGANLGLLNQLYSPMQMPKPFVFGGGIDGQGVGQHPIWRQNHPDIVNQWRNNNGGR